MLIIGVVGQIASGKEVFAQYLIKKYGFSTFSLSTVLHQELERRKINSFTRKTLQNIGDELRKEFGDDVLARRAVKTINNKRSVVITGIRNPAEVIYLKKLSSFILVAVKTKKNIRFRRMLLRGKPWDPKTWQDFDKIDRRDFGIGQGESGQQVGKCIKMADYTLTNNKGIKDFQEKVKKLMKKIL